MSLTAKAFKLIFFSALLLLHVSCSKENDTDECLKTKWQQTKTYEIKLAVKVRNDNSELPGGSSGSKTPEDFKKMTVGATVEMVYCDGTSEGELNIGNSYIVKGQTEPADIYTSDAWWIGHVVYVFEFGNDQDHLDIKLNVKITMANGLSYVCTVFQRIFPDQIEKMAGDMFHFILLDIYSNNWIKV